MQVSFGIYARAKEKSGICTQQQYATEKKISNSFIEKNSKYGKILKEPLARFLHNRNLDIITVFKKDGNIDVQMQKGKRFKIVFYDTWTPSIVSMLAVHDPVKNKNKKPVKITINPNDKPSKINQQIKKFADDCFSFVGERRESTLSKKEKALKEIALDKWLDENIKG